KLNKTALFVVMATAASPVMAQSLTGGEISLGYSALTDEDLETSGTQLGISAEVAVSREIALQGDVSYLDGEVVGFEGDETSLGLHAIYHANEQASFGYFFGQDRSEGEKSDFYGVEGGFEGDNFNLEGYFGVSQIEIGTVEGLDVGELDLNRFGILASYDLTPAFTLMGRYDDVAFSDLVSANRLGLGVNYAVTSQFGVSAEVGKLTGEVVGFSEDETYANVTASYTFGSRQTR
ncbi:MAG: hypothetical protein LC676_09440, partial [Loktanella sp.]|nr:hypothetical protein [Loktanella sp.]